MWVLERLNSNHPVCAASTSLIGPSPRSFLMLLKISMYQHIPKSPESLISWVTAGRTGDRLATQEGEASIPAELPLSSSHLLHPSCPLYSIIWTVMVSGELGTSLLQADGAAFLWMSLREITSYSQPGLFLLECQREWKALGSFA